MEHLTNMTVVPKLTPPVLHRKTNGGVIPPNIVCLVRPFSDIPPGGFSLTFIHTHLRGLMRRRD